MTFLAEIPIFVSELPGPGAGSARVLVCEDEGLTALRLQKVLVDLGYEVVGQARDGEEAVYLAERLRPDIILMDVHMPRLDGIEAMRRIMREYPTTVVMLTAYSDWDLVQRALSAGASGYLVKPVADEQLRPAITVALARFAELEQERETAWSLARSFISETPRIPGFQVASRYEPASEVARVGGDFFDFFELDSHRVGLVIGDVCGKGVAAATYTATTRHMLRAYSREDPAPARVFHRLNRALYDEMRQEDMFVTLVYGVLDRQAPSFTYSSAGHPPPVLYDPGQPGTHEMGACRELKPTGGIMGAMPEISYTQESVALPPGAVLALFTDGVTEAHTSTEMLGSSAVCAVVQEHAAQSVEEIAEAILARAQQFAGGFLHDDVAIVVLKNG